MASGKQRKRSKSETFQTENPKKKLKRLPLGPNRAKSKSKKINTKTTETEPEINHSNNDNKVIQVVTASQSQQLRFFLDQYQSAKGVKLSSLELGSIKDTCIVELSQGPAQTIRTLAEHMKVVFGPSWKKNLCEKHLVEGKIEPANPALLVISLSAIRSLELLRELRSLTRECQAAKLFSKHMKIEDQVSILKNRVNIASGTPNRIKKLIDMEALGLSRLSVVVLDMQADVKGFSLLTLPQVRDEFWDLYKSYFHQRLIKGEDLRICLYGAIPVGSEANAESASD